MITRSEHYLDLQANRNEGDQILHKYNPVNERDYKHQLQNLINRLYPTNMSHNSNPFYFLNSNLKAKTEAGNHTTTKRQQEYRQEYTSNGGAQPTYFCNPNLLPHATQTSHILPFSQL